MSSVSEEPQSFAGEQDPETVIGDLRKQLDAVKARMSEHRSQMDAVGLRSPSDNDNSEQA
jgi:hypothetical protein